MRLNSTLKKTYLDKLFFKNDSLLEKIRHLCIKEKADHMQISEYEGSILQFLCRSLQIKKAVEIGTLYGYSSLMIARAIAPEGELFTLDIDQLRQKKAQDLMKGDESADKIKFIPGPAMNSLKILESKAPFDMVFIDADKNAYLDYLHWSSKNLKSGGLLVADNTFLFGSVYGENIKSQKEETISIMKKFNEEVINSGLYTATLLPTEEGLTIGIKN